MTDPQPHQPDSQQQGLHPGDSPQSPPQELSGPIPLATVLSYAHRTPGQDSRSRGWLITAGILWSVYSIGPLIITAWLAYVMHASYLSYKMWNDPQYVEDIPLLAIVATGLLALGVISIFLGISCFKGRRRITTFAPAFSIYLLMADLLLTLIVSPLLIRAMSRPNQPVVQVVMGLASLPKLILPLLCWIHLRKSTQRYLLAHEPRPASASPRPITQWLLTFWAIAIGCMGVFFWAGFRSYYSPDPPQLRMIRWIVPIIAAGAFLLARAIYAGNPFSRTFGIVWYGMCLITTFVFHGELFDRDYGQLASILLLSTLIVLHARSRFQPASSSQ